MRARPFALLLILAVPDSSSASSHGTVIAWGRNTYGESSVPINLGPCISIAAGGAHSAAVQVDGAVRAWGVNTHGQLDVPVGIGPCIGIAAGESHTVALQSDGGVRAWGRNNFGQCDVPLDLAECTLVATGQFNTVVVSNGGIVRAWGANLSGQSSVPTDLGSCVRVDSGNDHTVAIRADGVVRAWGSNAYGQCTAPPGLGTCQDAVAGDRITIALQVDGSVRYFGNNPAADPPPSESMPSRAISVSFGHAVSLRRDLGLVAWGSNSFGQCDVPAFAGICNAIAAGYNHSLALIDFDCDRSGVPDADELSGHDCNQNLVLDRCEASLGLLEDCNANGLGDSCEKRLALSIGSGRLAPIGYGVNHVWTIRSAVRAQSVVRLTINAHGDFSGPQEFIRVRMGLGFDETALRATNDCGSGMPASTVSFAFSPEQFNAAIAVGGDLALRFEPSIAVDPFLCPDGTWLEAVLEYEGVLPSDCNANGLLDDCEIAAGYSPDSNQNGVIDTCESLVLPCPPDFNQDSAVNGADLSILLSAWGAAGQPGIDLNSDGYVNGADLGLLLSAWGPCPN